MSSGVRLLQVVSVGTLVLVAVVGSFWLAQADVLMTVQESGPYWSLPTPTLYPTEPPAAAVIAKPTPAPAGSRRSTPLPVPAAVETVSPTATPQAVCEIPSGWVAYVVRDEDTWESLAQRSQTNAQELLRGNCLGTALGLSDVPLLYLPAVAAVVSTPTRAVVQCKTPPAGWLTITVAGGETLWGLAQRYGTTPELLMLYNCLPTTGIQAGSSFHVPPTLVQPPKPLPTAIWLPTVTATPTLIPTDTPLPTPTSTDTPVPSPTLTPSLTPTPTETPVLVPTWTPVPWPWPTAAPAQTPSPTETPSPQETLLPTVSPPAATLTGTPDVLPTATPQPTSTAAATSTAVPTSTPLPTATPESAPTPTTVP